METNAVGRELSAPSRPALNGRDEILLHLMTAVTGMMQDWDRDDATAPLGEHTYLVADLGFQSLDIIMLAGGMSRNLNRTNIPFERLLLVDGRPIKDLSLGMLADFLWEHVKNST